MLLMKQLKMMMVNNEIMTKVLGYFRWHNIFSDSTATLSLIGCLSAQEQQIFDLDLRKLDLNAHAQIFMYGVGKYYCGLDLLPPDDPLKQVLKLSAIDYNYDIKFALKSTKNFKQ